MPMKRIVLLFAVVAVFMPAIAGCGIKEDRGECPCRLFLDMTDVDRSVMSPLALYITAGGVTVCDEVLDSAELSGDRVIEVPREELSVVAWGGCGKEVSASGLLIPLGEDCPPVYIHASSLRADGECVSDTLRMRKNHCVLDIMLQDTDVPYRLAVRGNVSGFDPTGKPSEGEFYVPMSVDTVSTCSVAVCLPRQLGDDLYLDVSDGDGKTRTFHLSRYMAAAGYDWTEPDLKDLSLTLNYTLAAMTLMIQGWTEEFIFDVVI